MIVMVEKRFKHSWEKICSYSMEKGLQGFEIKNSNTTKSCSKRRSYYNWSSVHPLDMKKLFQSLSRSSSDDSFFLGFFILVYAFLPTLITPTEVPPPFEELILSYFWIFNAFLTSYEEPPLLFLVDLLILIKGEV